MVPAVVFFRRRVTLRSALLSTNGVVVESLWSHCEESFEVKSAFLAAKTD